MKSIKSLLAVLILAATAVTGCQEELFNPGIDQNKPAPEEFTYDDINSSETAIAVYWNAEKAIAAGATSFTVQIPTGLTNGNNYSSETSQTLKINAPIYDAATFSGLSQYATYYARVRANYPNSVYSDWVYLTLEGTPVKCEVGFGYHNEEYPTVGEYEYDNINSSKTKMAFAYNAAEADDANAENVRVQLLSTSTGQVVYEQVLSDFPGGTAVFDNLKSLSRYRVRARAEYANPVEGQPKISAPWVYFKGMAVAEGETEPKETEVFQTGVGAVIYTEPPMVQLVYASSSTLTFKWSTCAFADAKVDIARPYTVALYKDKDCKELVVSWNLDANQGEYNGKQPSFLFSGLEQNTAYYFVVTDQKIGSNEPLEAKTTEFNVVTVGETPVAEGEYALAEDFSEFVWGGDAIHGGVAYSSNGRSSATALDKAEGENPVGLGSGFYLIPASTEMGLFNTLKGAVPTTRLAKWGTINEGTANSYVCARSGLLKIGASKYTADISTPVLSNLASTATVEVSFDAARYDSDDKTMAVKIVHSATENAQNVLTDAETEIVKEFVLDDGKEWKHFSFEIPNVEPTARIAIAAKRNGTTPGTDQHRFYLDNVQVKVVAYGSSNIHLDPPVLETKTNAESIVLTWNEVKKAETYTVEYKVADATEWTVVEGITGTTYTIEGLLPKTAYSIRIKAVAGEFESEYATPSNVVTGIKPVSFPLTVQSTDELVELFAGTDLLSATETSEVILGADIDLAGKTLNSVATFAGILNGNGKTIRNWNTSTPLFEELTGTVKDLVIDASCVATPSSYTFGIIANESEGTISKVTNNANVTFTVQDAEEPIVMGAIVGKSMGTLTDCVNNGNLTVNATSLVGSGIGTLAGYQAGVITNCDNTGALKVVSLYTSAAASAIKGHRNYLPCVGGIVGIAGEGFEMTNSENTGSLTFTQTAIDKRTAKFDDNADGRHLIGGLVGAGSGDIKNSKNNAPMTITATHSTPGTAHTTAYNFCIGGIVGGDFYAYSASNELTQHETDILNCSNSGKLDIKIDASGNNSTVGGIVGWPNNEATQEKGVTNKTADCSNTGNITISGPIKGRFGGIQGGTGNIENCSVDCNLTVNNADKGSAIGLYVGNHSQNHTFGAATIKGTINVIGENTMGVAALVGNQGNADTTTSGQITIDATINAPDAKLVSMITGQHNKLTNKARVIVWGSEAEPIKVKGSVNGTTLTAENYATFCECGYASGTTVFATVYAKFWN